MHCALCVKARPQAYYVCSPGSVLILCFHVHVPDLRATVNLVGVWYCRGTPLLRNTITPRLIEYQRLLRAIDMVRSDTYRSAANISRTCSFYGPSLSDAGIS